MTDTLNEMEAKFLEALFGEAEGDVRKAAVIAGYSNGHYGYKLTKRLKDEILKRAENALVVHAGRAVLTIAKQLDADGTDPGANLKADAAKQILDRIGLSKKEKIEIDSAGMAGLFILPAKKEKHAD